MVVYEYSYIVGIGDDTVGHMWSGPFPMNMDAGTAEGGVCEVTVVHRRLTASGDVETVQTLASEFWCWCIKLKG